MSVSNDAAVAREAAAPLPHPRYGGLEGLRGIAALAIVVYHVFQFAEHGGTTPGGGPEAPSSRLVHGLDGFVDLFFVLSAFLLAVPFFRSALNGGAPRSARAFLAYRAARVVPLYLVAVTVVWAVRNPRLPGDWLDLLLHLTFLHVFDPERIFWTIGPAWSLAVEVHFYLLLALLGPWVIAAASRRAPHRRWVPVAAVVIGLAALGVAWKAVAAFVLEVPWDHWPTWFALPAKLDVFAVGLGLAWVTASGRARLGRAARTGARVAGGAVVLAAVLLRPIDGGAHLWFHTACAVGFGLLLAASVLGPGDVRGVVLDRRALVGLGLVSYSLYLWHEPVLLGLAAVGVLPPQDDPAVLAVGLVVVPLASLAVAWVSYRVIEVPAANLRAMVRPDGRPRDYYAGD